MAHLPTLWQSLSGHHAAAARSGRRMLLAGLLSLTAAAALAQTSALRPIGPSESSVKAAYLLKFLNYVEWPAASFGAEDAPYVIGVASDEAMFAELQRQTAGRAVQRRPVTVRRVSGSELPAGVHVLFIGAHAERARFAALLRQAQELPVLLVTDTDGALDQGSMINFRMVEDRVRFEVALEPVRRANLELNTRLLSVAIAVNKGTPP
jgi:hypothetical protein